MDTGYSDLTKPVFGPLLRAAAIAVVAALTIGDAQAQDEAPATYTTAELEELVGPVALYPDTLLAIVLPAASYPLQIVEAARYLEALDANPDLQPDDDWDDAVVALLNYPEVIELMNDDLDWTWDLGAAVVNQQDDVLAAVQSFRGRAVAAGNLQTDDRQTVSQTGDVIEVTPVDSEVIYVPYYEPSRVVVYQRRPVYYYYPRSYPLYYYPYPANYSFSSGFFWGVTTAYVVGWRTHRVHFHHIGYASHPYYGRRYVERYRVRHARRIRHRRVGLPVRRSAAQRSHIGTAWRPGARHGAGPRHRTEYRAGNRTSQRRSLAHRGKKRNYNGAKVRHRRDTVRGSRARSTDRRHDIRAGNRSGREPGNVQRRHRSAAPGKTRRRPADGVRTQWRSNRSERAERRDTPRRQRAVSPRIKDGRGGRKAGQQRRERNAAESRPPRRAPVARAPRADKPARSRQAPVRQERRRARQSAPAAGRDTSKPRVNAPLTRRADQVRGGPSARRARR